MSLFMDSTLVEKFRIQEPRKEKEEEGGLSINLAFVIRSFDETGGTYILLEWTRRHPEVWYATK